MHQLIDADYPSKIYFPVKIRYLTLKKNNYVCLNQLGFNNKSNNSEL